jgi:poly(ribitol-phosphate) beta-N-acetylglucosaminyltransferase
VQQVVAALVVDDRLPAVEEIARWEVGIKPTGRLEKLQWDGGALRLGFTAEYLSAGEPMGFRSEAGGDVVAPPLSAETLDAMTRLGVAMGVSVDKAKIDLVLRERTSAAEFYQPVEFSRQRIATGNGGFRLVLDARATVDPDRAANGAALAAGLWDVVVRISVGGWTKEVRLGADRGDAVDAGRAAVLTGSPPRLVLPYWTDPAGNLTLEVDQASDRIDRDLLRMPLDDTRFADGRLQVGLPLRTAAGCDIPVRFTRAGEGSTVDLPGRLEPAPAGSVLTVSTSPGLGAGAWWAALGIPSAAREVPHWAKIPIEVGATTGSVRPTKVTPPRAARGKPPVLSPLTDYAKKVRRRLRRMGSTGR